LLIAIRSMHAAPASKNSTTPVLFQIAAMDREKNGWVFSAVAWQQEPYGQAASPMGRSGAHSGPHITV
jgi:hypothetical protein